MLCALIMAGGRGTRFWPLSTEDKPKQFLNLIGNKTMIQMTVDRINRIIPMERIFICTGDKYKDLVMEQLPDIPEGNIIIEPEGRNTAPCIALSALIINRMYEDSTMVVLPSDQLIENEEEFVDIILDGSIYLNSNNNSIVTIGIKADRPETGYGYIKYDSKKIDIEDRNIYKVERFVEKPNKERAEEYLREGTYLWNGGMFIWKSKHILNEIEEFLPKTYRALKGITNIDTGVMQEFINNNYGNTDTTSIDYGILEKADNIYVIPANIGWDDIGSWNALERYRLKDDNGNISMGNTKCLDGKDNLIVASKQKIIVDRLDNIYVIENDGQIILGKKENVKDLINIRRA